MVFRHNVIVTASKVKKCDSFLALKTENWKPTVPRVGQSAQSGKWASSIAKDLIDI